MHAEERELQKRRTKYNICNNASASKESLMKHKDIRMEICNFCDVKLSSKQSLNYHIRSKHAEAKKNKVQVSLAKESLRDPARHEKNTLKVK